MNFQLSLLVDGRRSETTFATMRDESKTFWEEVRRKSRRKTSEVCVFCRDETTLDSFVGAFERKPLSCSWPNVKAHDKKEHVTSVFLQNFKNSSAARKTRRRVKEKRFPRDRPSLNFSTCPKSIIVGDTRIYHKMKKQKKNTNASLTFDLF